MRLLKGFIITIAGFFVVITLVSLLMPSQVITSRTINIAAPPADIVREVSDLNNWRNWHPLFSTGGILVTSTDTAQYAEWISGNKKNQLLLDSKSSGQVRFTLLRSGENSQQNKISLLQFKDSSNVQVEWSVLTKLKWYPWEKFSGIFIDNITGPGYEAALNSLKRKVESPNLEN